MFRPNAATLGLTSFWSYHTFNYDEMGNRQGWASVGSKGWMHYLRRDNGLNQYLSWENNYPANDPSHWGSGIFQDDNFNQDWHYPGNGVTMAEGNLVASYNALNQPVAMIPTGSSDIFWFGYDPLGLCVKRTVGSSLNNGTALYLYYDGWNH